MKKILWILVVVAAAYAFTHGQEQVNPAEVTKVEMGGPFELVGTDGQAVSSKDFADKHMLIFFGFTFCPDICPTTLTTISTVLEKLDETNPSMAAKLAPIFVTVDPERDTVEALKDYMSNFDERIVGLTGSKEQIRAVADAYKVYYAARKEKPEDTDYLVDHSGYVYLMSPNGDYMAHFTHDKSVDDVLTLLSDNIKD